ncbi:sphingomyelin phosphodiesterase isoform X1 [Aedes aegypti]|uniref:Sphingomyelin phosphodiesterase n=1 Tax=Aedes aegypti TaxID=7159 RepID=A0A6I8T870_AEDAE|nr:sphingomyelin phosphodiesterase isoform X1 [Aedes aegypti]XP_021710801.1 sphingomyelin phosphodiesterase isoform X1 [Aedes aegypti]XP_021710802.1 sphingomyelin phosphodiesterase isoform X1 [Aedes aegypti]XP_021710804.1 sphingomyelin phosphodiesterase isoform X1 [Aedes aegypti]XP_021710805.1 sphingomyelin phosphodiesterase isoform X1 [Aedes aegypti]XP_021710806.1 sphingomyelin phosphodiesterase isoform X1 [Aedes aegypti]XP_021710807.1 sphingomyelin phosphodiesterase isoform X1 [Aedes aegypt
MSQYYFPIFLVFLLELFRLSQSHPFVFTASSGQRKAQVEWHQPDDDWNIQTVPRSVHPLLENQHNTHRLPPTSYHVIDSENHDDKVLKRLMEIKENATARTLFSYNKEESHLPPLLTKTIKYFNLQQVAFELETSVMSQVSCTACKAGAGLLQHYIRTGKSKEEIIKTIYQYCVNLKIQSPRVCEGVSQLFGVEVIYVLKRVTIGPDEICSFIIGDACEDIYNPYHEWEVDFPPVPKPEIREVPLPQEGAPVFKVLHLSDTHFDPYYAEGSNADCNEPLCCRLTNGRPTTPNGAAGKWGDYRKCDTPQRTVDHMLSHIAETHSDIDFIIWTGDLPPHDVWNQTKEENLKVLKETVKQMSEKFPGIPIFPALGNHESAPVNSFPPPYVQQVDSSISWLYDELDIQWRRWLPASVSHTVRRGAFYSVLVRPGYRIISMNMNYCNNKNWWLLLNSTDPATELSWFIYELQSAEFANEKVHVIGHIPPGHSDCLKVWSRNYYKIVSRYENTIVAQFFGHTHFDEFEVFYDPHDLSRATSIAYIGPSVTPYYDLNPGYRIYYIDGDHDHTTRLVVDHESWIMNLKEANLYDYPIWYKLYSTRAAYTMRSLRPVDWDILINNMTDNKELFDLYYKHYWKNSPVRPECDFECRKRILCDAKSGRSHDRKYFCEGVEAKIDENNKGWKDWLLSSISSSGSHDRNDNNSDDRDRQGDNGKVDADSAYHQQLVAKALEDNLSNPSVQLAKG